MDDTYKYPVLNILNSPSYCRILMLFLAPKRISQHLFSFYFSKKTPSSNSEEGIILSVDPTKCHGFLRSKDSNQKVYFHLRSVINSSDENVELCKGLQVKFEMSNKKDQGYCFVPPLYVSRRRPTIF